MKAGKGGATAVPIWLAGRAALSMEPGSAARGLVLFRRLLLLVLRRLVMHAQDLAVDRAHVDLLDPRFAGHGDVERIDQLAVLPLELLGAHHAVRHLGESRGAG